MQTTYEVHRPDGSTETVTLDLPEEPGFHALDKIVRPYLDGQHMEHVTVLFKGGRSDMFVPEFGDGLPRNEAATAIYRAATLADPRNEIADPEFLGAIYGVAVVFHRRVWF